MRGPDAAIFRRASNWRADLLRLARTDEAMLAAILVLAAGLRVAQLDAVLWYDEILTLTRFVQLPPSELAVTYGSLNNHVLYTWLAKASVSLFGESAFSLRLPAMLFGLGSIWAAWLLLRTMGFRLVALGTALILALSYHHVWFSQNARGYTGMLFFATLGSWQLMRALATAKLRDWAVWGLLCGLSLLVHLSAVFIVASHGLMVAGGAVLLWRKADRAAALRHVSGLLLAAGVCIACVLAVFAPLIPGMIAAFSEVATPEVASGGEAAIAKWRNPLWTLVETFTSFGPLALALPPAMVVAALGARQLVHAAPIPVGGLLLAIPLTLVALILGHMRIWPRYFFAEMSVLVAAAVAGAVIAADWACRLLAQWRRGRSVWLLRPGLGAGLALAAMALASLPLLARNYDAPKQDFTRAMSLVDQLAAPGDVVAATGLAIAVFPDYLRPEWRAAATVEELAAVDPAEADLYVVTCFPDQLRSRHPEVHELLMSRFEQLATYRGTLAGGSVTVWRRVAPLDALRTRLAEPEA